MLAHAKLNLCLSLGPPQEPGSTHAGRDASGYHRIATWMSCIDLGDDLAITPLPAGEPSRYARDWAPDAPRPSPISWPIEKDLVCRAHRALEAHVGRALGADVRLRKRIPTGAGLGGGSSDAGAMLAELNRVFQLGLDVATLRGVGAGLGSDVPFFVDAEDPPAPALVGALGDEVERIERVGAEVVLVVPPFECASRDVFRAFDDVLAEQVALKRSELAARDGPDAAARYKPQSERMDLVRRRYEKSLRAGRPGDELLFNDLYPAAVRVEPRVGRLAGILSRATRCHAHLTGSGSCLFLLARDSGRLLGKVRSTLEGLAASDDEATRELVRDAPCVALRARLV